MKVAFSKFVKRQTPESQFTHWNIPDAELLERVIRNFDDQKQGYRDGVILIPINPTGCFQPVKILQTGDQLYGDFSPRVEGEEPRQHIYVKGEKTPAKAVEVVLYRHDVLQENNEASCDAQWEIISVNGAPTEEPQPIQPMVLLANHFQISGGTKTNMTAEQLEAQLRVSFIYWKDKALSKPC